MTIRIELYYTKMKFKSLSVVMQLTSNHLGAVSEGLPQWADVHAGAGEPSDQLIPRPSQVLPAQSSTLNGQKRLEVCADLSDKISLLLFFPVEKGEKQG